METFTTKQRAFISQPMLGLADEEILKKREEVTRILNERGYEVIDSFIDGDEYSVNNLENHLGVRHIPVYYLGESLKKLSKCDVIYICKGAEASRGCAMEIQVAKVYGISCIYEE